MEKVIVLWGFQQPFWFYSKPVDFRRQIDGLMLIIADQLNQNPTTGQLFIFRNRQANKLKLLWWDHNGFVLVYKRIEKGRFKLPAIHDQAFEITKDQLSVLLAGLDFMHQDYLDVVSAKHFF